MTDIKTLLQETTERLIKHTPTPRLDAEVLLIYILKKNRAYLYAHGTDTVEQALLSQYQALILKRIEGQPIAYLTGEREFWSLSLNVNEATLIPRPETELLVETTLDLLQHMPHASILDLGTGSGAISLALAFARPDWTIMACDKYEATLNVARENAKRLNLHNITFILSDWFSAIPNMRFDAIVSNPPYLAEHDPHQQEGDLRFEPRHALVSGPDGLNDIRHIIQNAPSFLKDTGLLLVEHGFEQGVLVKNIIQAQAFKRVLSFTDIENRPRISGGWL